MPAHLLDNDAATDSAAAVDTDIASFTTTPSAEVESVKTPSQRPTPSNSRYASTKRRQVRLSDRRLADLGAQALANINWRVVRSNAAAWTKKKGNGQDFAIYTHRTAETHYVMASGIVHCSLIEMQHVLHPTSDSHYGATMNELYGSNFIYGAVVHRGSVSTNNRSQFAASEVTVKTATFVRPHMLARNQQWCYVDYFPSPLTKQAKKFELVLCSLHPDDVFAGKTSAHVSQLQDMTAAYRVEQVEDNRKTVRVVFFAQYQVGNAKQKGKKDKSDGFLPIKRRASSRAVMARLVQMAAAHNRLAMIVRRRRLNAQVFVDQLAFLPSNSRCICCTRLLKLLRKKTCHLCGYFVCEKCSIKQQVQRSRIRTFLVRICEHCLERIDDGEYDNLPEDGAPERSVIPSSLSAQTNNNNNDAQQAYANNLPELLSTALTSASATKKSAVKSVIKHIIEQELEPAADGAETTTVGQQQKYSSTSSLSYLMPASSEEDYRHALSTQLSKEDLPLDQCIFANVQKRSYCPFVYHESDPADDNVDNGSSNNRDKTDQLPRYPTPDTEEQRLSWFQQHRIDTLINLPELEIIAMLVSKEMQCPVGMVTLITKDSMVVVATNHDAIRNAVFPRAHSMCSHAIMSETPLLLPHPEADVAFNRMNVITNLGLRFYCGFPIQAPDKSVIGMVCSVDYVSHRVTQTQYTAMKKLAETASKLVHIHAPSVVADALPFSGDMPQN